MLFTAWVRSDLLSVPHNVEFWLSLSDSRGTGGTEQDQVGDRRVTQGWNRTAESGALPGVFTTPTTVPCPVLRSLKYKALSRWGPKMWEHLVLQRWCPAGWEHHMVMLNWTILRTSSRNPQVENGKRTSLNSSEIMFLPHGIMMLTTAPLKSQHLNARLDGNLSQHCTQWNEKMPRVQHHFNIMFYKFKTIDLWKKTQTFCREHNNLQS